MKKNRRFSFIPVCFFEVKNKLDFNRRDITESGVRVAPTPCKCHHCPPRIPGGGDRFADILNAMTTIREIASLFSGGRFFEVEDAIAEDVEWHIYEEKIFLAGKKDLLEFCRSVAKYFESVTTNFQLAGILVDDDKVAIYGRAEFIRDAVVINFVHSCDVYEFDSFGRIARIYSYCNSKSGEE